MFPHATGEWQGASLRAPLLGSFNPNSEIALPQKNAKSAKSGAEE
jgi:hypothetical protein